MKRHSIEKINKLKQEYKLAINKEQSITDKYSTNYIEWCKCCEKTLLIERKLNKMIREYNYDNGLTRENVLTF